MKTKLVLVLLFFSMRGLGQMYDNVWPLSIKCSINPINFNYLDFTNGNPDTFSYSRPMSMFISSAALSSEDGDIQYYSNGIWIANRLNDTLLNSNNFNPGYYTNYYNYHGMGFSQSIISLPIDSNISFIIYESAENISQDVQPLNLRYSKVDMTLDSGKGGIVPGEKSVIVISDTLILGRITAIKHGNGRDWWVLVHKYNSDVYYSLLVTANGVIGPNIQSIGNVFPKNDAQGLDQDIFGMSQFSPDGSKYVNINCDTIQLFDFDRCTGLLSNYRPIYPNMLLVNRPIGCSFSPNSRFLYSNTRLECFQTDTYSSNLTANTYTIAQYDSFISSTPTWFMQNQLGPDGKIYLSTYNATYVIHTINDPDSSGLNCNFYQHNLSLPGPPSNCGNVTLPNFPNYRLGRLVGSPCDTLTSAPHVNPPHKGGLGIVPNPNNGNFIINYSLPQNTSGILQIFDVMGKQVYKQVLPHWSIMQRLSLTTLPAGMYVAKVTSGEWSSVVRFVRE